MQNTVSQRSRSPGGTVTQSMPTPTQQIAPGAPQRSERFGSKLVMIALTITALAALANLLLAVSYVIELREQKSLVSEIEATRQALSEYSRPSTVEKQLAEVEVALASEQEAFPVRVTGAELTGELLRLANASGLKVSEATTQPGDTREIGQHTYRALSAVVQVTGTLEALQALLQDLEEGALPGVRIDEVGITDIMSPDVGVPNGNAGEQTSNETDRTLVAALAVSVYERLGRAD